MHPSGSGGLADMARVSYPPKKKLAALGFESYAEYLASALWEHNRLRVRGPRQCWVCGSKDDINVHHRTYASLGDEKPRHLLRLCRSCHHALHELVRDTQIALWGAHIKLRKLFEAQGRLPARRRSVTASA